MAKHYRPKQRGARTAALAGAAAAGVTSALVVGTTVLGTAVHHDVALAANTAIGVGGRDDTLAERVQTKLSGQYALDFPVDRYVGVEYPANLLFQSSIDEGIPALKDQVTAVRSADPGGRIRVVSFSEGTLVAEQVKRDYAAAGYPQDPATLNFEFMASPNSPNGGIFARFPGFQIPGLLPAFSAAQPTRYDSTYVTNEYDGFADFPAYFNPLSLANAVAGMAYAHPDQYYDAIMLTGPDAGTTYVKTVDNGAGGKDTYIFVVNPHLPLLAPIRQVAALTQLTPLTEPVLGAVEPLLRVAVDMGYTDRTNANPGQPTPFSLITPPGKIVDAVTQVPGALQQGGTNVQTGGQTPSTLTERATDQGGAGQNRTTLNQADEVLAPSGSAPKKAKPVEKKDPFQAVSSAVKKGLQSTLRPTGTSPGTGAAEVKKVSEPTSGGTPTGGTPNSEPNAKGAIS